jgi:hypothetical protein
MVPIFFLKFYHEFFPNSFLFTKWSEQKDLEIDYFLTIWSYSYQLFYYKHMQIGLHKLDKT